MTYTFKILTIHPHITKNPHIRFFGRRCTHPLGTIIPSVTLLRFEAALFVVLTPTLLHASPRNYHYCTHPLSTIIKREVGSVTCYARNADFGHKKGEPRGSPIVAVSEVVVSLQILASRYHRQRS